VTDHTTSTDDSDDGELSALLAAVAHAPPMIRAPRVGDVIGDRYEIEALLGRGGMGHVFAARDRRTERSVALKWMTRTSLAGTESDRRGHIARFLREARIAAKIVHPNVVAVYDVKVDDESPYLVMERLRGETLRARIDRGPLSWDEALELLLPAMRGVAALHRAGIIHRDVKPDNIFLCAQADDIDATTKVLDFGISHVATPETDGLTRTGAMLGTPSYMPLEQLRGAKSVGPEVDVYALGVVLYEMLAGERPFEARSTADHAVLLATQKPRHLGERIPPLAGTRADAVMRALSRDSANRFRSVEAFAEALRTAKPRRRAWPVAVGVGLVLSSVLFALGWTRSETRADIEPEVQAQAAPIAVPTPAPVAPAQPAPMPVVAEAPPPPTSPTSARATPAPRRRTPGSRPAGEAMAAPPDPATLASPLQRAITLNPGDFR
jgi:serine/threonine protein kinase